MTIERVAISGIGVVAPGAVGVEQFAELLERGQPAITTVERFDTSSLRAHSAGLVSGFQAKQFIAPGKLRRMNTQSRQAVAATKMALRDAGLDQSPYAPDQVGVALGTCFGPVQTSVDYLKEYVERGAALAPPQLFAESVANAPGSHIAIEENYRGFNVTFTQRESSALAAAMFAASQIVKETVAAAVAGGVEEINDITYSVLDRIGALAHDAGEGESARAFDRRRNGMAVGEGAAMFFLEGQRRAGAPEYGFLSGFGIAKDPSASVSDWGSNPDSVVKAMREAIEDAGLSPGDIDALWASANGSLRGDRLEAQALRLLFADRCPPVVATKGYFGEYAAAGGLHLASAALAMRQQRLFGSIPTGQATGPRAFLPEEGLELPITTETRECPMRHILINSLSAGGGIISAVLSREVA